MWSCHTTWVHDFRLPWQLEGNEQVYHLSIRRQAGPPHDLIIRALQSCCLWSCLQSAKHALLPCRGLMTS